MTTQNPEVNSRPFFLSIPETVARNPNLSPAAKCVAGSIYTRTHQRNVRPGVFVLIRADWIAAEWAMSADAVTAGIKQLEAAGIVERNRTRSGNVLRWSSYEEPDDQDSGNNGIREKRPAIPEKAESAFRKKRNQDSANNGIGIPEKAECILRPEPRPEPRPETESARTATAPAVSVQVQAAELEPHESGLATRLPEPDREPELPETVRYLVDRISPAAMQWAWMKVAVQGIDPNDWRLVETLRKVFGSGKRPNGFSYFEPIFNELPLERPAPPAAMASGSGGGYTPQPKESIELIRAKAGLETARRLLPRGECTAEDVQRYEQRVAEAMRKAAV